MPNKLEFRRLNSLLMSGRQYRAAWTKPDRTIRPGGCSWRNITSGWGRLAHAISRRGVPTSDARQWRDQDSGYRCPRRSRPRGSWRGLKHRHDLALPTPASGSARWRPPGLVFCDGNRGLASIQYVEAIENLAFAAATAGLALTGLHVQPRLAVGDVSARQALILLGGNRCCAQPPRPPDVNPPGENAPRRGWPDYGRLRPPSVRPSLSPFSS
jgi:hypothetical protein